MRTHSSVRSSSPCQTAEKLTETYHERKSETVVTLVNVVFVWTEHKCCLSSVCSCRR